MHERLVRRYIEYTDLKTEDEATGTLLREVDTWMAPQEAVWGAAPT